jgi:hypothetical protein
LVVFLSLLGILLEYGSQNPSAVGIGTPVDGSSS